MSTCVHCGQKFEIQHDCPDAKVRIYEQSHYQSRPAEPAPVQYTVGGIPLEKIAKWTIIGSVLSIFDD